MNIQIHSSNFSQLIVKNILRLILPDHVIFKLPINVTIHVLLFEPYHRDPSYKIGTIKSLSESQVEINFVNSLPCLCIINPKVNLKRKQQSKFVNLDRKKRIFHHFCSEYQRYPCAFSSRNKGLI